MNWGGISKSKEWIKELNSEKINQLLLVIKSINEESNQSYYELTKDESSMN